MLLLEITACVAQAPFDVAVFPSKIELNVIPGTNQEFAINVRNTGTADQVFKVYNMDYLIKSNNDFVFKEPGHYTYSCAKWISTEAPELLVPAGTTGSKKFVLSVPADAEPGGHYAVVFFEQTVPTREGEVKARGRIGSTILVTVPGEIVRKGKIESVSVTSSWFWPSRKVLGLPKRVTHARVVVKNEGNVHLTVKGKLTYAPTFGWGTGSVRLGEITVLPGTTRYLDATLPNPPLLGSYKVRAEVSYGPSLDVFDTTVTKEGTFHQYPLSWLAVLLGLVAIITALVILLKWLRRKRKKKGDGEAKAPVDEDTDGESTVPEETEGSGQPASETDEIEDRERESHGVREVDATEEETAQADGRPPDGTDDLPNGRPERLF